MSLPETEKVVRSICQACHCECGVLIEVRNGKVVNVKGDPDHPMNRGFVCIKGRVQPEVLYHPDRLLYPLKQTGGRGSGKWVRVTWDQALDEIAGRLTTIREKYGPESLATIHGTGPRSTTISTALLANALGSPNVIRGDQASHDHRFLGSGDFVSHILKEADKKLSLRQKSALHLPK